MIRRQEIVNTMSLDVELREVIRRCCEFNLDEVWKTLVRPGWPRRFVRRAVLFLLCRREHGDALEMTYNA